MNPISCTMSLVHEAKIARTSSYACRIASSYKPPRPTHSHPHRPNPRSRTYYNPHHSPAKYDYQTDGARRSLPNLWLSCVRVSEHGWYMCVIMNMGVWWCACVARTLSLYKTVFPYVIPIINIRRDCLFVIMGIPILVYLYWSTPQGPMDGGLVTIQVISWFIDVMFVCVLSCFCVLFPVFLQQFDLMKHKKYDG